MAKAPIPPKHVAGYGALGALTATLAAALWLGGTHTAPPASSGTPIAPSDPVSYPVGFVAQQFSWAKSADATGYRLYLDGVVVGNVSGTWTAASLAVKCGVKHRINVQPFNNQGLAPLAPPVYVTPPCDKATR
jgi:hypothetical protein